MHANIDVAIRHRHRHSHSHSDPHTPSLFIAKTPVSVMEKKKQAAPSARHCSPELPRKIPLPAQYRTSLSLSRPSTLDQPNLTLPRRILHSSGERVICSEISLLFRNHPQNDSVTASRAAPWSHREFTCPRHFRLLNPDGVRSSCSLRPQAFWNDGTHPQIWQTEISGLSQMRCGC